jgi:hypothetical protein
MSCICTSELMQCQFVPDLCVPDRIFLDIASLGQKRPLDTVSLTKPYLALGVVGAFLAVFLWRKFAVSGKQGSIPEEISQALLTNKKQGNLDYVHHYMPTTLLNHRKLALIAGNTLFAL